MRLRSLEYLTALAVSILALGALAGGAAAGVLAPFQETPVITGLTNPTAVRFAPDGRIFVSEQSGLLKVYSGLGDNTPDIVADLRNNVMNNWDRGFLGLAIDPQFPAAGHDYVYVLYTVDAPPGQNPPVWNDACADQTTNGCVTRGRLSRLRVAPDNTLVGGEQILIDDKWCFQYVTHSIGDLHFGPEGALYVSGGEGASFTFIDHGQAGNPCGDPPNEGGALRSQDLLTPADPIWYDGSVLRLDVSGPVPVPWPTNPLVGVGPVADDPIIAHGFRNPYRFTIHPGPGPQAGEVWVGDVGADTWEEINRIPSPSGPLLNFGWPCYEGGSGTSLSQGGFAEIPICAGLANGTIPSLVTPSVFAYRHDQQVIPGEQCGGTGGGSITGVAFYGNGTYPPEYRGALFFEDYTRKCIWAMLPNVPGGVPNPANRRAIVWNSGSGSVDIEVGPGGDLFYAEYTSGQITRLQSFASNHPPVASLQAQPSSGPAPLSVAFDASGSTDVDPNETFTYAWDLDGDGLFDDTPDADPRFAHGTYTEPGVLTISVLVTDSKGATSSASQAITVANSPPVATILTPSDTVLWRVGDQIFFSGMGTDPEEGVLPASALSWQTIIHHCATLLTCHTHNVESYPGVDQGSFIGPDHSYPSYLELKLTVSDSGVGGGWFDSAWSNRRKLRFDNSVQTTDLVGFPVLIALNPSNVDYQKTENAGQDLRFVDTNGTVLPHQIEAWNETGTSYVWVRVPQIPAASSAGFIWMYYGNPAAPDGQSPLAVWDSTYAAVWHLGAALTDSTAQANGGVDHGSVAVPGQIGGARNFDGASWIEVPSSPSLAISSQITLESWVKINNPLLNEFSRILDKKLAYDGPQGYDLEYQPFNDYVSTLGSGGNWGRAENIDLDTQWHWISATISGTTARVYVDGIERTTDNSVSPLAGGSLPLNIARNPAEPGTYWQGALDEVRISNVARSPDWMHAQYLSMTGAFANFGPEESFAGLTGTASVLLYPETRDIAFSTTPSGLQLTVGGEPKTTPFTETVITNSLNSISASSPQPLGGVDQLFSSWSDGGGQSHEITATPSTLSISATFVSALCGNGALDAGEDCDDHNTMNGDCCSALCHFEPSSSTCSDGNACTTGDTCSAGTCNGGPAPVCSDSNACTADSCVPATGCVYNPAPLNGTTCSDSNACTTGEQCNAGVCGGGSQVICNDLNACTQDSCNTASGCIYDPAPLNGVTCSDGEICTLGDQCSAGTCVAGPPAPDGDTDGKCNASDNCPYVANPGQEDAGGISLAIADGIGDLCQCADITGNGIVDDVDVADYRTHLTDPAGLPFTPDAASKCSVAGGDPAVCDILDVVIIRRATHLPPLEPAIQQQCIAALPH